MKPSLLLLSSAAAVLVLNAASCRSSSENGQTGAQTEPDGGGGNGPDGSGGDDGGSGPLPFTQDPPSVYVAKVKNLLVGLPPTDTEVKAVEGDASQLGSLVDTWMTSTSTCAPSTNAADTCLALYQTKMLRFFELAFQQTQIGESDFNNQLQPGQLQLDENSTTQPLMVQNQQEVFARTMLSIAGSGQPFNTAMTTQSYMMTTAMKAFYALTDAWQLDNDIEGEHDYFASFMTANHPGVNIRVTAKTVITLAQTLDPTSEYYMEWYDPTLTGVSGACDPLVYSAQAPSLFETVEGFYPKDNNGCTGATGQGQLTYTGTTNDFNDWTMVNITQPQSGQATTNFYDLATLRGASQMVLNRPYVGYFTTPAFFANWQTNASNEMRVTMNQTFIVATGAQVDGTDPTEPTVSPPPGLDSMHATAPACLTCHQLLDPSRSIFSSTFSWYYGQQIDSPAKDGVWSTQKGMFIFRGTQQNVSSIYQLGSVLSTHPLVAPGWTQKLCYYIDSQACVTSDPEFQRIATLFQTSNYSWNALVKAIVTSPLTTHTAATLTTTTNGETVAVARRDHLCAALNARLGLTDVCGLDATKSNDILPKAALAIVPGLPSDGYGRGSVAPVLPNDPTLFYRAGTENFCEALALVVVDGKNPPAGATTWSSSNCSDASCQPITDFVNIVAGIPPSDPRATPLYQALLSNFDQSKQATGMTASEALQSTFIAACIAPSAISIGL
jgi:hypothetical protein